MASNEALGSHLKKLAKAKGGFVEVQIPNVFNTLDVLSYFFYGKKHEWVAICFFDEKFDCKQIWFNKGENYWSVGYGIGTEQVLSTACKLGLKNILLAHNHPISSYNMPDYGSRRMNIIASYQQKAYQLQFSDQDNISGNVWHHFMTKNSLEYAESIFVAGRYIIRGSSQICSNYNSSKPWTCLIASVIYGVHAHETSELRYFRDSVLNSFFVGRSLCKLYYAVSPFFVGPIERHPFLERFFRLIITAFVKTIERNN